MKFKALSISILMVLTIFCFSCSSDDDEVSIIYDDLPQQAMGILNEYFPGVNLVSIQKETENGQIEYEVKLENGFEIDFDAEGNWTSIDGNGQEVPSGLIPETILAYIQTNYPNTYVEEIERKSQGYKVELSDDTDLYFDLDGNFISADSDIDDDNEISISFEDLPQAAQDLLNAVFPGVNAISIEKETEAGTIRYEVKLANGFEIDFDAEGNWTSVEGNGQEIPSELILSSISDYIQTHYPGTFVQEIERNANGYKVELSDDTDLYFDLDGNFISADTDDDDHDVAISFEELPQAAQDLLNSVFPDVNALSIEKETEGGIVTYEVKLANGFEFDFDEEGNWTKIDGEDQQVPDVLIPTDILDYVQSTYPALFIVEIKIGNNRYEVELSNELELFFDL